MSRRDDQARGATPGGAAGTPVGKLTYLRRLAVHTVVIVLPESWVDRLRRRRAKRRYLNALSYELVERETHLEDLEQRVSAQRDGFYRGIVKDVLERTDVVLQELDRRIEGLSARTGERLGTVEEQLAQLREQLERLRQLSEPELGSTEAPTGDVGEAQEPPARAAGEPASSPATGSLDESTTQAGTSGNGRVAAAEHAATTAE